MTSNEFLSTLFVLLSLFSGFISFTRKKDDSFFNFSILSWLFLIFHFSIESNINSMLISFYFLMATFIAKDNYKNYYLMGISTCFLFLIYQFTEMFSFDPYKTLSIVFILFGMFLFRGLKLKLFLLIPYSFLLLISFAKEDISIILIQAINIFCIAYGIRSLKVNQPNESDHS